MAKGIKKQKEESVQDTPKEVTPVELTPKDIEHPVEKVVEPVKVPEPIKPMYRKEMDANLTFEERILSFLEGRKGVIKLNDFLKSLYAIPKLNATPQWALQASSKQLKMVLDKMQADGLIKIVNDRHRKLGTGYYVGTDQRLAHRNISDVIIEVAL